MQAGRRNMTERNERCPCGSGLKYKKCHGKNAIKGGSPMATLIPIRDSTEPTARRSYFNLVDLALTSEDAMRRDNDRRLMLRRR